MSILVEQALNMAVNGHAEQTRKYDGKPYMNHIYEVLTLLKMANVSEPTLLAGILHDALEDTNITQQDIAFNFSTSVLETVLSLTDNKELTLAHRHQLACQKALVMHGNIIDVKLADLISNMTALPHQWDADRKQHYLNRCGAILEAIRCNPSEHSSELEDLANFVYLIVNEGSRLYSVMCNWADQGLLYWSEDDCCLLYLPEPQMVSNIHEGTRLEPFFGKLFHAQVLRSLKLTNEPGIDIRETSTLNDEMSTVQSRHTVDHCDCVRVRIAV